MLSYTQFFSRKTIHLFILRLIFLVFKTEWLKGLHSKPFINPSQTIHKGRNLILLLSIYNIMSANAAQSAYFYNFAARNN